MLDPFLQMVSGMKIAILPKDESVLAVVPSKNLIAELMELEICVLVVNWSLGEELERTTTVVVPKLKMDLASLKIERQCVIMSGLTPGMSTAVHANRSTLSTKVVLIDLRSFGSRDVPIYVLCSSSRRGRG